MARVIFRMKFEIRRNDVSRKLYHFDELLKLQAFMRFDCTEPFQYRFNSDFVCIHLKVVCTGRILIGCRVHR